jgi:hypothetical protein
MDKQEYLKKLLVSDYLGIGSIDVHCDSYLDTLVEYNLGHWNNMLSFLIEELIKCAKWRTDYRHSAKSAGNAAYKILTEINERLNEIIENEQQSSVEDIIKLKANAFDIIKEYAPDIVMNNDFTQEEMITVMEASHC